MSDNKLTDVTDNNVGKMSDSEIVKGLEICSNNGDCKECPINPHHGNYGYCTSLAIKASLDLINRLQGKVIKEQNKNSKLRNERNRLQAQNKDLAETVHNLTLEKDALFDKAEELKAEIKRLNALVKTKNKLIEGLDQSISYAYDRAIKEFAERLKKKYKPYVILGSKVAEIEIDNLLKELVGE